MASVARPVEQTKVIAGRRRCPDCKGIGEIFGYRNVEDGPMDVTVWPCGECRGEGTVAA